VNVFSIGIVGAFMLFFLILVIIADIYDYIDQKSKKYQILDNYDFMQFYLNKYHNKNYETNISTFELFLYLIKVKI
jgi:hypothetical protein